MPKKYLDPIIKRDNGMHEGITKKFIRKKTGHER